MEELNNFITTCNLIVEKEFNNAINDEGFVVENDEETSLRPRWNRMSQILLSGPDLSLTIKLYYDLRGFNLCKEYREKSKSPQFFVDFTKELCNVIGGRIKAHVDMSELSIELSLPFSATTFDDLFIPPPAHQNVVKIDRLVKSKNSTMGMTIILEFKSKDVLEELNSCEFVEKDDSIEFF